MSVFSPVLIFVMDIWIFYAFFVTQTALLKIILVLCP